MRRLGGGEPGGEPNHCRLLPRRRRRRSLLFVSLLGAFLLVAAPASFDDAPARGVAHALPAHAVPAQAPPPDAFVAASIPAEAPRGVVAGQSLVATWGPRAIDLWAPGSLTDTVPIALVLPQDADDLVIERVALGEPWLVALMTPREEPAVPGASGHELWVWDLTSPGAPRFVGRRSLAATVVDLAIHRDYVHLLTRIGEGDRSQGQLCSAAMIEDAPPAPPICTALYQDDLPIDAWPRSRILVAESLLHVVLSTEGLPGRLLLYALDAEGRTRVGVRLADLPSPFDALAIGGRLELAFVQEGVLGWRSFDLSILDAPIPLGAGLVLEAARPGEQPPVVDDLTQGLGVPRLIAVDGDPAVVLRGSWSATVAGRMEDGAGDFVERLDLSDASSPERRYSAPLRTGEGRDQGLTDVAAIDGRLFGVHPRGLVVSDLQAESSANALRQLPFGERFDAFTQHEGTLLALTSDTEGERYRGGIVWLFDVSDPAHPRRVGFVVLPDSQIGHRPAPISGMRIVKGRLVLTTPSLTRRQDGAAMIVPPRVVAVKIADEPELRVASANDPAIMGQADLGLPLGGESAFGERSLVVAANSLLYVFAGNDFYVIEDAVPGLLRELSHDWARPFDFVDRIDAVVDEQGLFMYLLAMRSNLSDAPPASVLVTYALKGPGGVLPTIVGSAVHLDPLPNPPCDEIPGRKPLFGRGSLAWLGGRLHVARDDHYVFDTMADGLPRLLSWRDRTLDGFALGVTEADSAQVWQRLVAPPQYDVPGVATCDQSLVGYRRVDWSSFAGQPPPVATPAVPDHGIIDAELELWRRRSGPVSAVAEIIALAPECLAVLDQLDRIDLIGCTGSPARPRSPLPDTPTPGGPTAISTAPSTATATVIATATVTATARPSATSIPTPTATVGPSASPTGSPPTPATSTATPRISRIHLPRVVRGSTLLREATATPSVCRDHLVFVVDASPAMAAPLAGVGRRIDAARAAIDAAATMIAEGSGLRRVSLVSFHHQARVRLRVEPADALAPALVGLSTGREARLDLGLRAATRVLADDGSQDRRGMVLLTAGSYTPDILSRAVAQRDPQDRVRFPLHAVVLGASEAEIAQGLRDLAPPPGGVSLAVDAGATRRRTLAAVAELGCP